MVVSFTSNLALAKPDDSELAANWARLTKLQEDNNLIIYGEMSKISSTYFPTFTAASGGVSEGSTGGTFGEYMDFLGIVQGNFQTAIGGVSILSGSGEYGWSLPFVVDSSFHSVGNALNNTPGPYSIIGEGYFMDASASATSGSVALDVVTVGGVSYVRMLTEAHTTPAKTSRLFRDSMPYALADGDRFFGNFLYKKA